MTRLPDQIDAPMTPRQLAALRTLSAEAYQPKLFEKDFPAKEAERRISALKAEIELANSFCTAGLRAAFWKKKSPGPCGQVPGIADRYSRPSFETAASRPPRDEVQLVETQQPHAEARATRASRSMGSKQLDIAGTR